MIPAAANRAVGVLVLLGALTMALPLAAQSDETCVAYMEADHRFAEALRAAKAAGQAASTEDERWKATTDGVMAIRQWISDGLDAYKGPRSEVNTVLLELLDRDRDRCRLRGFRLK